MRPISKIAPDWWDYTTLDDEILNEAARLSADDLLGLSRDGFSVRFYDTLEDFYLAEALEYIDAWRQATEEEIVAGCAPLLRGSDKPGRVVGTIFDWLLGMDKYGSGLHISVLRNAVFEMISTRFIPSGKDSTRIDPMQEYLQKEMLLLAREALEETMVTYGWRKGGSAEFRDEYERAGWDMLEESIVHGKKPRHHEALGRHIRGCDVETYRKTHMGSFQNFWKALWDTFLKKIRADI
jgi:hypothetical protein